MKDKFTNPSLSPNKEPFMTEREVRELIASSLANWTGITRFRTIESTITTISDFTSSQHDHSGAVGGGQLNPANCFNAVVPVASGGTGVATLTGIAKGNGSGIFTAVVPLAGTKVYYVADSNGGAVTRKLTLSLIHI